MEKALVDLRARMVPARQKWQLIANGVQEINHSREMRNHKNCKDKWIGLNSDYQKVVDYHKGIGSHTSFWDLGNEEKDRF